MSTSMARGATCLIVGLPVITTLLLTLPAYAVDRLVPSQYETIQQAIYSSSNGDTVIIAPGIYTGTNNRDISFQGKAITVRSTNPADPQVVAATIVDAQGTSSQPHRGFRFTEGETSAAILDGLTIQGGWITTSYGGGIFCGPGSPTIRRCRITNNRVEAGNAYGGGIYVYPDNNPHSDPTIADCEISQNVVIGDGVAQGGGSYGASLTRCMVVNNTANGSFGGVGGGAFSQGNTFDSCVFRYNAATYHGGYPRPALGGGFAGCGKIISCTFTQNSAARGGAAYCDIGGFCNGSSSVLLVNSILYGDLAPEGMELGAGGVVTITTASSNIQGGQAGVYLPYDAVLNWGEGMLHRDPVFSSDGYHLAKGSPCIDSGNTYYTYGYSKTDIDGQSRVMNGAVDMGADETFYVLADFDADGDVDANDIEAFNSCLSGPSIAFVEGCSFKDLDGDGDVDSGDFGLLQRCFNGANELAVPNCQ